MHDFPQLLKAIRKEAELTQSQLAKVLGVSTILVAMIESGQREPSKKFVEMLARRMDVSPRAIVPFIYEIPKYSDPSSLEASLVRFGMKLQQKLIKEKAKNLIISRKCSNG